MGFKEVATKLGLLAVIANQLPAGFALELITADNCADLSSLASALEGDDVAATVANDISCDAWTTVVVPSTRQLTIEAANPARRVKFTNIRFEVEAREGSGDAYDLIFTPDVKFFTTIDADVFLGTQDVDGGVLNVQSGAAVLFEGYTRCVGISIASALVCSRDECVPAGGGWIDADHKDNGACWYNEGRIRAEGEAVFKNCDNSGGGENQPGGGGAVYNHVSGLIELAGGVDAKKNSCNDDEGGQGGAIYNAGAFVVGGAASFSNNIGGFGGAIYNDEGATFDFATDDTISFFKNRPSPHNENGGHIFSAGPMKFESYVKFLKGEGVITQALMEFEGGALFKKETEGALIASRTGDFGDTLALVEFKKNEVGPNGCADLSHYVNDVRVCGP